MVNDSDYQNVTHSRANSPPKVSLIVVTIGEDLICFVCGKQMINYLLFSLINRSEKSITLAVF